MKKLLLVLIALVLLNAGAKAQTLNGFFQKYDNDCRIECISVGRFLFNLALLSGDIKGDERELLGNMRKIKILTTKESLEPEFAARLMQDLQKVIRKGNFENLVEVREKGERVNIYTRMSGDSFTDLLIAVKEAGEFNVIWINGKISREIIEKLQNDETNETLANIYPTKIKL